MIRTDISRRRLLVASLAVLLGPAAYSLRPFDEQIELSLISLARQLAELGPMRTIGLEYLSSQRTAPIRSQLLESLEQNVSAARRGADSGASIPQLIALMIRDDFRNDQIVEVANWWLSRTEVQLCALAALDA